MFDYKDGTYIYNVLTNDSTVTTLVGTAIYNDLLIPQDETSLDTINYYPIQPYNGGLEYFNRTWSVNCRSKSLITSRDIAKAVYEALNRVSGDSDSKTYFGIVSVLPTLPPFDDTDVYNTPIDLQIRRRS